MKKVVIGLVLIFALFTKNYSQQNWKSLDTINNILNTNCIKDFQHLTTDNYVVCTNNGLAHFSNGIWEKIDTSNSDIPTNNLTCLYYENYNDFWLGSYGFGLIHFSNGDWEHFDNINSPIPSPNISTITSDGLGNLWIGCYMYGSIYPLGGGLVRYDESQWQVFTTQNSGLPHNSVWAITNDLSSKLYIGTGQGGEAVRELTNKNKN